MSIIDDTVSDFDNDSEKSATLSDDEGDDDFDSRKGIDSSGELTMSNHNIASKKTRIAQKERQTLARNETRAVNSLRILFFIFLFITAALVCFGVYYFTSKDQQDDFENEFQAQAIRIMEQFHDSVEQTLQTMDSMSVATTSFAKATSQKFPMVTIPDFIFRGASSRALSEALFIVWTPLVTDETRYEWQNYTQQVGNQQAFEAFLTESAARAQQDEHYGVESPPFNPQFMQDVPETFGLHFKDEIWKVGEGDVLEVKPPGSGPFFPLWQLSPTPPAMPILNLNLFDMIALTDTFNATIQTHRASIGAFTDPTDEEVEAGLAIQKLFNTLVTLGQYRLEQETYMLDPVSPMMYPVFESLTDEERKLAGVFVIQFYWRLYFTNVLPEGVEGMICVLENTLGQVFTYELNGPDATYLGATDSHDKEYDVMEVYANVGSYVMERAGPTTRSYTAVDLNKDFNNYKLRIYPSQTFEEKYVTNKPLIYTGVVAGIFFFTSLVFLMYDCFVERRQQVVMDRAVKSSLVVSSLFPENVRDRLLNEAEGSKTEPESTRHSSQDTFKPSSGRDTTGRNWLTSEGAENEIARRLSGDVSLMNSDVGKPQRKTKAIADKFAETTVMFGDIAGFTQWSAFRQPDEVFTLLETLYVSNTWCTYA